MTAEFLPFHFFTLLKEDDVQARMDCNTRDDYDTQPHCMYLECIKNYYQVDRDACFTKEGMEPDMEDPITGEDIKSKILKRFSIEELNEYLCFNMYYTYHSFNDLEYTLWDFECEVLKNQDDGNLRIHYFFGKDVKPIMKEYGEGEDII